MNNNKKNDKNKKIFKEPLIEITNFDSVGIIATSGSDSFWNPEIETPIIYD